MTPRLQLVRGGDKPLVVVMVDDDDRPLDLTTFSQGQLTVRADESSAAVLTAMLEPEDLVNGELEVVLTESMVFAVPAGTYIAEVWLNLNGQQQYSERFLVEFVSPISDL